MAPLALLLLAAAPVNLRWEVPAGCPDEAAVVAEVVRLLPATTSVTEPLEARGVASTTATGRWQVELEVAGAARSFEAASCTELADATALVLAMAIDPSLEPPAPPPLLEAADAGVPVAPVVDAGVEEPSTSKAVRFHVRPQAGVLVGRLPAPAAAFGGGAGVQLDRLRLEARVAVSLSQRVPVAAKAGAGADLQLVRGGARGCFTFLEAAVTLSGCGGLDVGALRGRSFGVSAPATGTALELGLALGPSLAWSPVQHLSLWVELEGQLALARPSFTIDGLGLVHQVPPLGLEASGGLEVWW